MNTINIKLPFGYDLVEDKAATKELDDVLEMMKSSKISSREAVIVLKNRTNRDISHTQLLKALTLKE